MSAFFATLRAVAAPFTLVAALFSALTSAAIEAVTVASGGVGLGKTVLPVIPATTPCPKAMSAAVDVGSVRAASAGRVVLSMVVMVSSLVGLFREKVSWRCVSCFLPMRSVWCEHLLVPRDVRSSRLDLRSDRS